MGSCGLVAIAEAQATTGAGARSTNWSNADVRAWVAECRAHWHPMLTQFKHQHQGNPAALEFTRDDKPSPWASFFQGD
jgi:hypothetical protein